MAQTTSYHTALSRFNNIFQICIPTRLAPFYKCICKSGYELSNLTGVCVKAIRSEFILYGQQKPGMVKGIPLGALEPKTEVIIPMVDLSRPTAMDYHAKDKDLYIADSQKLKIERQSIDNGTKHDFLSKGNFEKDSMEHFDNKTAASF